MKFLELIQRVMLLSHEMGKEIIEIDLILEYEDYMNDGYCNLSRFAWLKEKYIYLKQRYQHFSEK